MIIKDQNENKEFEKGNEAEYPSLKHKFFPCVSYSMIGPQETQEK